MRKRDSSSGRGDRRKPGGRSSGRSNARSNDSRGEKPFSRSRDNRDDSKPRRPSKFSGDRSEGKSGDFSKPPRKSFGRSKDDSGFSSRGERSFSRSRDDRDDSKPRRSSKFSDRKDQDSKFSKPRGGKSFGRSKDDSGERSFPRSRDDRDDSKPKRSFRSSEEGNDNSKFSKPHGGKPGRSGGSFGRKERSDFSSRDERGGSSRDFTKPSRREGSFDKGEGKTEKKGFFSKLSRSGKSYERRHDSDFGKSVKDFSQQQEEAKDPGSDKIRLNRYISNSGVCSRREADELIKMGLVSVNGTVITEMGYKVDRKDVVKYDGKTLRAEKPVYILLNKPKGFLTTTKDPQERNTVMQIIAGAVKERVYPVGRLDRNTTGLLLLTNDGELTDKLSHPSYNVKKIYKVELDKPLTKNDFQKIKDGVQLEEGRAMVDDLAIVSDDGKTVGLEIHIGWNRVIRRIFERLEYQVVKLDRSVYAGLDKKDLSRGHWRFLTKEEIVRLKHYK
jgi:23S rRNA pseudouridine2605 synthase